MVPYYQMVWNEARVEQLYLDIAHTRYCTTNENHCIFARLCIHSLDIQDIFYLHCYHHDRRALIFDTMYDLYFHVSVNRQRDCHVMLSYLFEVDQFQNVVSMLPLQHRHATQNLVMEDVLNLHLHLQLQRVVLMIYFDWNLLNLIVVQVQLISNR